MIIDVNTKEKYKVYIENGILDNAGEYLDLDRKVLIVTDSNIPEEYVNKIKNKCREPYVYVFKAGEESKNLDTFKDILKTMLENSFARGDAAVAVGGGVCGDMTGFAASCYMRGICFYNIPTSLLSQVDSSVGGKTAVDFMGVKNVVGTFFQPSGVLIDPQVLKTLDKRQFRAGMAEVIKMAACLDGNFFKFLEENSFEENIGEIIKRAVECKAEVVEKDEKEGNLRKVLNFGHTIGHCIEETSSCIHGEAVAAGMMYFSKGNARERIANLLKKNGLETKVFFDKEQAKKLVRHDKKAENGGICAVVVEKIGEFMFKKLTVEDIENLIERGL